MNWFTALFKRAEDRPKDRVGVITALVVDRSLTVRKTFEAMFREEAYRVSCTSNEADARALFPEVLPDVVFIDADLPEQGAANLCRFIKGHPKMKETTVFLLVSAFAPFDTELAKRLGANGHFRKPLESIKNVIDAVDEVTARREKS